MTPTPTAQALADEAKQALRNAINSGWNAGRVGQPQYMAQNAANAACAAIDAAIVRADAARRAQTSSGKEDGDHE